MNVIIEKGGVVQPVLPPTNVPYPELINVRRRRVDLSENFDWIKEIDRRYIRDICSVLKIKDLANLYKYTLADISAAWKS